jgi:hypothetical protein
MWTAEQLATGTGMRPRTDNTLNVWHPGRQVRLEAKQPGTRTTAAFVPNYVDPALHRAFRSNWSDLVRTEMLTPV